MARGRGRGGAGRSRGGSADDDVGTGGRSGRAAFERSRRGAKPTLGRASTGGNIGRDAADADESGEEEGGRYGDADADENEDNDDEEDPVERFHRARRAAAGGEDDGDAGARRGARSGRAEPKGAAADRRRPVGRRVQAVVNDDDDDDDDGSVDGVDTEEVYGLGLDDDEEDDDDDGDEGAQLSDSDVELEAPKQHELSEKAWGRKRQVFYDADIDREDEDGMRAEEEEAQRMQRQRLKDLDTADFGLDAVDAAVPKTAKTKAGRAAAKKDTLAALAAASGAPPPAADAERIARDISRLTADEARELVAKDSPELLGLLADLQDKLAELQMHLGPLLERVDANEYRGDRGLSLLQVKHQLLLSYCTNLCFYFYLKAAGIRVSDHPVVGQLVEQRALLEKIKPLETKLKYQIDRLVRAATTGVAAGGKDSVRPNPSRLVGLRDEDASGGRSSADADAPDADAKFRPSRLAPMPYDPDAGRRTKAQKSEERLRERASRSRLLRDLEEEFTDAPTEIVEAATERSRVEQKLAEQEAFEEDHFVRLPTTRKDRALKRQRLEMSLEDELDALRDFADLADYTAAVRKNEAAAAKEARARQLPEEPAAGGAGKRAKASGSDEHDDDDDDDDVDAEAAAYYNEVKAAKERKQRDRAAAAAAPKHDRDEGGDDDEGGLVEDGEEGGAGGKRGATAAMIKNRGLTARRKKEQRNPRVRRRMQYEKAQKKLASTGVRVASTPKTAYGGEATGIKRNVARSVALH